MNGAELIAAERRRQVEAEGFDAARDAGYVHGELAFAAVCYALPAGSRELTRRVTNAPWGHLDETGQLPEPSALLPKRWPEGWDWRWWKPAVDEDGVTSSAGRLVELARAGALIAAEMDRLIAETGVAGAESDAPTLPGATAKVVQIAPHAHVTGGRFVEFVGDGDPLRPATRAKARRFEEVLREVVEEVLRVTTIEVEVRPLGEAKNDE